MISSGAGRWAVWVAGKQTRARRCDGDYFCGDAAGDLALGVQTVLWVSLIT